MVLSAWAARTSRVPLGTMVSAVGYRNVGLTVKMATALDHASGGRAMLGIGAGWHEPEIRAFGYEELSLGERMNRLDEAAHVARRLLDGEAVTFEGRWVRRLRDAQRSRCRSSPGCPSSSPAAARSGPFGSSRPRPTSGTARACPRSTPTRTRSSTDGAPRSAAIRRRSAGRSECRRSASDRHALRRSRPSRRSSAGSAARPSGPAAGPRARRLADTEEVVAGHFRAWRAAGAEEAIIDIPVPFDDETMERLAGPIRERLA